MPKKKTALPNVPARDLESALQHATSQALTATLSKLTEREAYAAGVEALAGILSGWEMRLQEIKQEEDDQA